ncbi:MAG: PIN/TRAM domain-containing protein, partial [Selenomonadaceae bacterium]|nr:PIN/TRAM domain-containing protein [Selenomonadaceae bacterium]
MMMDRVLRFLITLFFAFAGGAVLNLATPLLAAVITAEMMNMDMGIFKITLMNLICILAGAVAGGLAGWVSSGFFIGRLKKFSVFVEKQLSKMPIHDVIAGAVGLAIGLIIANLLSYSFAKIPVVGDYIPVIFSIVLGYLGIHITIKKRTELIGIFDFIPRVMKDVVRSRDKGQGAVPASAGQQPMLAAPAEKTDRQYKLLDTSVIIDGRIADICD